MFNSFPVGERCVGVGVVGGCIVGGCVLGVGGAGGCVVGVGVGVCVVCVWGVYVHNYDRLKAKFPFLSMKLVNFVEMQNVAVISICQK